MEEKITYAKEGEKIKVFKCKNCNERVIIDKGKEGTEVFMCDKCRFKVSKEK